MELHQFGYQHLTCLILSLSFHGPQESPSFNAWTTGNRPQKGLQSARSSWWHKDDDRKDQSLSEAKICSAVLRMFHRGVLLLDEAEHLRLLRSRGFQRTKGGENDSWCWNSADLWLRSCGLADGQTLTHSRNVVVGWNRHHSEKCRCRFQTIIRPVEVYFLILASKVGTWPALFHGVARACQITLKPAGVPWPGGLVIGSVEEWAELAHGSEACHRFDWAQCPAKTRSKTRGRVGPCQSHSGCIP